MADLFDPNPMYKDLVIYDGPLVEKGFIRVSEKPGIGVEINDPVLRVGRPAARSRGEWASADGIRDELVIHSVNDYHSCCE